MTRPDAPVAADCGHILPDVLAPGLAIVFCGSAAGRRSAQLGAYYAGPGNRFWATLHATGLTPRLLRPAEFADVVRYGLGLTDLCKTQSGADADLARGSDDVDGFRTKIERYRPAVVAFVGKRAAKACLRRTTVAFGPQPDRIGRTAVFVLPSPSGAARGFWDAHWWHELAALEQDDIRLTQPDV